MVQDALVFQVSQSQIDSMLESAVGKTIEEVLPLSKYIDRIPPLTVSQVAEMLNVTAVTIRTYSIKGKKLCTGEYVKLGIRDDGRYLIKDVIEFENLINSCYG